MTDYNQDPSADRRLVALLRSRFDEILFWPQGPGDAQYIKSIAESPKFVAPSLAAFDRELQVPSTAYVGLRLHAGIRAMQHHVPTLVMSIDNRTREISKSVGLVAPSRHALNEVAALVGSGSEHPVELPLSSIADWKENW
jgi:hypothetical protein